MKKSIIYLITTILIILIIQPLSLTSSAEPITDSFEVKSASIYYYSPSAYTPPTQQQMRIYKLDENGCLPLIPSPIYERFNSVPESDISKYPTYLAFNDVLNFTIDTFDYARGYITVDYGVNSFSEFNALKFSCSVFYDVNGVFTPDSFFNVKINGMDYTDYTLVYSLGPRIDDFYIYSSPAYPYSFRRMEMTVYFDETFFSGDYDVDFEVLTFLPGVDADVEYVFGFGNLEAELMSKSEFVSGISGGISNMVTQQGITNEKLGIMSDTMDDIKEILSETLSEEEVQKILDGQQALEEQSIIVKTNAEAQAELEKNIDAVFERYENIDYDLFGDNYGEYVQEYVDPVFEHSGFLSFWNGFWSHRFVIAMIITVITFCAIGFALYGIR